MRRYFSVLVALVGLMGLHLGIQADAQTKSTTTTTTTAKPTKITTADEALAAAMAAGWTNVTGLAQKGKGHGAFHGTGVPPGGTAPVPVTVSPSGQVHQGDVDDAD